MASHIDISGLLNVLSPADQAKTVALIIVGVSDFANLVCTEAVVLCPIEHGDLKASGKAEPATFDGQRIHCEISFDTDYAAAVHECITNKFSGKVILHPQGQAKFLETAMRANEAQYPTFIVEAIEKGLTK